MKDLIRKRWFVFLLGILVAVIALLIFGLILYCNGYRIVYPEQFETSWDAVSGFAAWFGVGVSIVSAVASFFAIWFAVRVADKQNKIALFEKRYECYATIQTLLVCASQIRDAETNKGVQTAFRIHIDQPENIVESMSSSIFSLRLKQKESIVVSGAFLFSRYDVQILQNLINIGIMLIEETSCSVQNMKKPLSDTAKDLKDKYIQLCNQYRKEGYIVSMEDELRPSDIK